MQLRKRSTKYVIICIHFCITFLFAIFADIPGTPGFGIPGTGIDIPGIPGIPGIGKRSIDAVLHQSRKPTTERNNNDDELLIGGPPRRRKRNLDDVCDFFDGIIEPIKPICTVYGDATGTYCDSSQTVLGALDNAQDELRQISEQLTIRIDFSEYFEYRNNQSQNFTEIQQAVADEINSVLLVINYVFSVLDKVLLAFSMSYLLFRSYQYHTNYRTKDKFDNGYITQQFKDLDALRKKQGKSSLLPLRKSERSRLIDVTSLRLSKQEKGLFKLGFTTLGVHVLIAALIILVDNCFYWLLEVIRTHGAVTVESSGEVGAELRVEGDNFLVDFVQGLFGSGLDLMQDGSFDTTQCLPNGSPPNNHTSIAIASCYLFVLMTVLTQAYALRLRRRIAEYFYPEREGERVHYIYNRTLKKRKTLFQFLKGVINQKQKELEAKQKVSLRVYLGERYPCVKKLFGFLKINIEIKHNACFGCGSEDDGTFQRCKGEKCPGVYCDECLKDTDNNCALCDGHADNGNDYAVVSS